MKTMYLAKDIIPSTLWYTLMHWYILWSFGIFCGHLVYFVVIWYILWSFGIFCGHLVYFVVTWYILWSLGIFCGHLVYFPRFGIYIVPRKIWQPWFYS
jgi:hypothetical protein